MAFRERSEKLPAKLSNCQARSLKLARGWTALAYSVQLGQLVVLFVVTYMWSAQSLLDDMVMLAKATTSTVTTAFQSK